MGAVSLDNAIFLTPYRGIRIRWWSLVHLKMEWGNLFPHPRISCSNKGPKDVLNPLDLASQVSLGINNHHPLAADLLSLSGLFYINGYGMEVHPSPNPDYVANLVSKDVLVYSCGSLWTRWARIRDCTICFYKYVEIALFRVWHFVASPRGSHNHLAYERKSCSVSGWRNSNAE